KPLEPYGAMPRATAESRALAYGGAQLPVADTPPARNAALSPLTERTLREVCTATLSSQLRKRGIDHHVIGGLRPTRPDLRLLGFARTLRYLPLREDVFRRLGGADN